MEELVMKKGVLAVCSLGCLGMVTASEKQSVTYKDGTKGMAYVGIHLTDKKAPIGSPWCSRDPLLVGSISWILEKYDGLETHTS